MKNISMQSSSGLLLLLATVAPLLLFLQDNAAVSAFSTPAPRQQQQPAALGVFSTQQPTSTSRLFAGGFEWEDPTESFDDAIENPFKNPQLMKSNDDPEMKIDPARLLAPRLSGVNLYLIGMMGTGKSSVGDRVARRIGSYNFLDTDAIIEKASGVTIPEIFEKEGEEGFRKVESQVLDSVHAYVRCVVSTGGGL
ncbi:MAG: hypothetical protein SGARI_007967, partial [Bacillariaceae sp.]